MWELRPGLYHLIVDARFQFNHPVKRRLGAEVPPSAPDRSRSSASGGFDSSFRSGCCASGSLRGCFGNITGSAWITSKVRDCSRPPIFYAQLQCKGHRDTLETMVVASGCRKLRTSQPTLPKLSIEAGILCSLAGGSVYRPNPVMELASPPRQLGALRRHKPEAGIRISQA
jgi:hypothetical protein